MRINRQVIIWFVFTFAVIAWNAAMIRRDSRQTHEDESDARLRDSAVPELRVRGKRGAAHDDPPKADYIPFRATIESIDLEDNRIIATVRLTYAPNGSTAPALVYLSDVDLPWLWPNDMFVDLSGIPREMIDDRGGATGQPALLGKPMRIPSGNSIPGRFDLTNRLSTDVPESASALGILRESLRLTFPVHFARREPNGHISPLELTDHVIVTTQRDDDG